MIKSLTLDPAGSAPAANAFASNPTMQDRIAALDNAGRTGAARQAEILGNVGAGLAAMPYAQRRAVLEHMAPALAARGLPMSAIAAFDPTDNNLASVLAQTRSAADLLGG